MPVPLHTPGRDATLAEQGAALGVRDNRATASDVGLARLIHRMQGGAVGAPQAKARTASSPAPQASSGVSAADTSFVLAKLREVTGAADALREENALLREDIVRREEVFGEEREFSFTRIQTLRSEVQAKDALLAAANEKALHAKEQLARQQRDLAATAARLASAEAAATEQQAQAGRLASDLSEAHSNAARLEGELRAAQQCAVDLEVSFQAKQLQRQSQVEGCEARMRQLQQQHSALSKMHDSTTQRLAEERALAARLRKEGEEACAAHKAAEEARQHLAGMLKDSDSAVAELRRQVRQYAARADEHRDLRQQLDRRRTDAARLQEELIQSSTLVKQLTAELVESHGLAKQAGQEARDLADELDVLKHRPATATPYASAASTALSSGPAGASAGGLREVSPSPRLPAPPCSMVSYAEAVSDSTTEVYDADGSPCRTPSPRRGPPQLVIRPFVGIAFSGGSNVVAKVKVGSAAYRAGVKSGDAVTGLSGNAVHNAADAQAALSRHCVGETVPLVLLRHPQQQQQQQQQGGSAPADESPIALKLGKQPPHAWAEGKSAVV